MEGRRAVARGCTAIFFFNDTATTEIYTLSLHDALPIFNGHWLDRGAILGVRTYERVRGSSLASARAPLKEERSEEHTSELQSRQYLVCRLLLEKKKSRRAGGGVCLASCRP